MHAGPAAEAEASENVEAAAEAAEWEAFEEAWNEVHAGPAAEAAAAEDVEVESEVAEAES